LKREAVQLWSNSINFSAGLLKNNLMRLPSKDRLNFFLKYVN